MSSNARVRAGGDARHLRGFALVAAALFTCTSPGAEYRVESASDIRRVTPRLQPGDLVTMAVGIWKDQTILFQARGSSNRPIILQAGSPGKTILQGTSSLTVEGEHVVVRGLAIRDGRQATNGILLAGHHCRLTECSITNSTYKFFVHLDGFENRMDHCYLAGKTSESPTLQIEVGEAPNHHLVNYNHFGPRPPLGRNGGETIRVGYSSQSMSNSATVVEHNLFDRCDGEIEIISSKSCENVYRQNSFLDCAGMLTLRHGNRCRVEGNFFIAHHKRGSGGIRVIGEGHVLLNNYIDGVAQGGIWVTAGIPDSPLNGYFRARDVLIAFNSIVDCDGGCLDLSAGLGSARRSLLPQHVTVANNVLWPREGQPLLKGTNTSEFVWMGNLGSAQSAAKGPPPEGIRSVDLKLQKAKDNLWRADFSSPIRNAAESRFASVDVDMDGQPRTLPADVGADQFSDAPVTNRPLTPAETGPSWLRRDLPAHD